MFGKKIEIKPLSTVITLYTENVEGYGYGAEVIYYQPAPPKRTPATLEALGLDAWVEEAESDLQPPLATHLINLIPRPEIPAPMTKGLAQARIEVALTSRLVAYPGRPECFLPMVDLLGKDALKHPLMQGMRHGKGYAGYLGVATVLDSGNSGHLVYAPQPIGKFNQYVSWLMRCQRKGLPIDMGWLSASLERGFFALRISGEHKTLPREVGL